MSTSTPHIDTHFNATGFAALQERLAKLFPTCVQTVAVREITLTVPKADVVATLTTLRDDKQLMFTQLIDLCGVDYLGFEPAQPKRFAVVYHLLSLSKNIRLRVKVELEEDETIPSSCSVYSAAGWYEREAYDMYGIVFDNHPDLRRILTDYGFVGFPLRKDFPLEGHVEVYYNKAEKRVAYKPVDLPQEFRHFDKVSDWEGATGNARLADSDNAFNREEFK